MEQYNNISKEKFRFVNEGERIKDAKFEDKPIGYFKDAWIRFRRSHAAVVATVIIILIILFSVLTPFFITSHDASFMAAQYAKKPGRIVGPLYDLGILDGSVSRDFSDKSLMKAVAMGIAAEDWDGRGVTYAEGMESEYQPIRSIGDSFVKVGAGNKENTIYPARIDTYLEVGFTYLTVEQSEYQAILDYEAETGIHVLYPLIEDNKYTQDPLDANFWYKSSKGTPVYLNENGKAKKIAVDEFGVPDHELEDNYLRDENGNVVYYQFSGGGTFETAQYKIRVLYYNYFQFKNGFEPNYLMGTDSQGYDLALRMAGGIKLSLLLAVCVSVINFVLGAMYGAVEGYYGGVLDLTLERIADVLYNVPFVVVATLFQIHLAKKVGAVPSLIFAYVLTGWIGTAHRVRTQFYRFKNQEYVMAARTLGAKDSRIIWKHIFPNSLGTIITSCALVIPSVIMTESMLSYLGIVKLGGSGQTSLGTLLSDASSIWTNYPHLMLYPALIISLLMICFNLFGNGLRDAFNPALRGVEE